MSDEMATEVRWVIDHVRPLRDIAFVRLMPAEEISKTLVVEIDSVYPQGRRAEVLAAGPKCKFGTGAVVYLDKVMGMEELTDEILAVTAEDILCVLD